MMKNLIKLSFLIACLSVWSLFLTAQNNLSKVTPPEIISFSKTLSYLACDSLEGREAGTRGAQKASEFIASIMQMNGLEPHGDNSSDNKQPGRRRSWYQNFGAVSYLSDRDSMTLIMNRQSDVSDIKDLSPVRGTGVVLMRNVLGIIKGKDTLQSILIGAHYDHLGIRDGNIYNGADDNASGVSGMLALAAGWSDYEEKPPVNLIFAAWAGEEKGIIGSEYFVKSSGKMPDGILICFNMDMISRSAPKDSSGRQLSIGTKPANENLRQIAKEINKKLDKPFDLDLWDVSGHYGSDYAYFSETGIPVMTFFSGYNSDYHTHLDKTDKVDLNKMKDILFLVNECIWQVADSLRKSQIPGSRF